MLIIMDLNFNKNVLAIRSVLSDLIVYMECREYSRVPVHIMELPSEMFEFKKARMKGKDLAYYSEELIVPDECSLISSGSNYNIVSLVSEETPSILKFPDGLKEIKHHFSGVEFVSRIRAYPKPVKEVYSYDDYVTSIKLCSLEYALDYFFNESDAKSIKYNFKKHEEFYLDNNINNF
jgi:hypothetical protein